MTSKQAYAGLLPCPFCGCEPSLIENNKPKQCCNDHAFVRCPHCHTDGPEKDTGAEAVAAWNTRPEAAEAISSLLKRVEELEALISAESIERLAEDIAIACVDCLPPVREARHRAMVRLGERLREPLPNDLKRIAALNSDAPLSIGDGQ